VSVICKDCIADWDQESDVPAAIWKPRPAPHPGPRCATHWREEKKRRKGSTHEKRVQTEYGLGAGDYDRLYEFQGGVCFICRRANGRTRKLSVDHDHKTGLVRGLICRPCNSLLGHLRDDAGAAHRIAQYLLDPPARRMGLVAVHRENREADDGG